VYENGNVYEVLFNKIREYFKMAKKVVKVFFFLKMEINMRYNYYDRVNLKMKTIMEMELCIIKMEIIMMYFFKIG